MITWMQRHKKWLVITIWISTIAFVGAGFVGWGSYDYSKSSADVAIVGNKTVKVTDLQNEYNTLYNQYQNAFGESFNQEMAKQFKLEDVAYNAVIQKFLLLNYADELGLYATNKDVAKYLVKIPSFIVNGKFDKDTYIKILSQNRTNPTDFENQIKMDILVTKVQSIVNSKVSEQEIKNAKQLYSVEDKLSINIINSKDISFDTSINSIKSYWEQNKEKYKSLESCEISLSKLEIGEKKKETKKEALKKYLKLKKDEIKFDETVTVTINNNIFTPDNFNTISKSSVGSVSKPLENEKYYMVTKLIKKNPPQALSFEKASVRVTEDYMVDQKRKAIAAKVDNITKNFTGMDVGFVSTNSTNTINDLTSDETQELIAHVSTSTSIVNSVILSDDKAIVYKIDDSQINIKNDISSSEVESTLSGLKNNEILTNLLKQLRNKYEVQSNMKVN